jgi:UTP--glucose-1-phosphate uridylyltransferase
MKTLHKAVIPAAGFGTRMLPAAKAVPKELLPVLDRPTIQYVVQEAADAGIDDVLLITSLQKPALMNHFESNALLHDRLAAAGKASLLKSIDDLVAKVKVHPVMQAEQRGLGDAVAQARDYAASDAFLCLLGDAVFSGGEGASSQLAAAYREFGASVIGLEEVPAEKVSRYGIVGGTTVREGVIRIEKLIEKPSIENAPSRFAIAARYVLTPGIFACLDEIKPGNGGEIQLTDALQMLARREPMHGIVLKGKRHDIGNPLDWLKTNITFAAADEAIWKQLAPMLKELLAAH